MNKKLKKEAIELCKKYNVDIYFFEDIDKNNPRGYASVESSSISINTDGIKNKSILFASIFHEIGHIHCYRNNLWVAYHTLNKKSYASEKIKKFRATAYKAECWVDRWGEKEMKKHYPKLKYKIGYIPNNKKSIKWLNDYYKWFYERIKN